MAWIPFFSNPLSPGFGSLSSNGSAGPATGGEDRVDEARRRVQELTEGRSREVMNDPYTASALDYLKQVTGGQATPFNEATQAAMRSRASDNSASAMQAQADSVLEAATRNGGSAQDPSVQAALRELNARRQTANQGASQDINAQANIANFNARMGGAANLASVRGAQNAQANQLGLAGAEYRSRTFEDTPGGGAGSVSYRAGGGSSARPAVAAAPALAATGPQMPRVISGLKPVDTDLPRPATLSKPATAMAPSATPAAKPAVAGPSLWAPPQNPTNTQQPPSPIKRPGIAYNRYRRTME